MTKPSVYVGTTTLVGDVELIERKYGEMDRKISHVGLICRLKVR